MDISAFNMTQSPKLIFEGVNSLIYYQEKSETGKPAHEHDTARIVKILREEHPSSRQIVQFNNEYEFTKDLTIKGIRKAYKRFKIANQHALLLEYAKGQTLKLAFADGVQIIETSKSKKRSLNDFLRVASAIAHTLGDIHRHHIIHKDINSNNILVNFDDNPSTLRPFDPSTEAGRKEHEAGHPAHADHDFIKIIDFGISSRIDVKMQHLGNPEILEGTLPYISPEQTGRMNRVLDYRTDLYSLGVTFYETLTGRLPFEAQDALELVHCHIAKRPQPLHHLRPEIPEMLSKIVMKLMAKNAQDRYQSAYGLQYDLDECLRKWEERGQIEHFELGQEDFSGKFQIPQTLYGRQVQLDLLHSAFERVNQGNREFMLVAGYSGIGKSALVRELYKPITQRRGFFISGKFDQFQRNIPYSAVVKAFQELVRQLLTESEAQLNQWRKKLLKAFGQNGQLLIEVIPEIELIVGPQPEPPALAPTEAQNRFNLLFQNFIRLFCDQSPLVIFLDDLQWADSASLKLIELMMSDEETRQAYLFLIGAYRDNEVNSTHPIMIMLDKLAPQRAKINQITLHPLTLLDTSQLIADTLHQDAVTIRPLAELVMEKTEGNPFFVNEFLKNLYQEQLLTFDVASRRWQWQIERVHALEMTDNVVELMVNKLRKLPQQTQQLLRLAACVGNRFDLETIAIIHETSLYDAAWVRQTSDGLMRAVQDGLVFPLSTPEVDQSDERGASLLIHHYKFAHDRVQQAAYALIGEQERKAAHLKIGRLLLANTALGERHENIFELVDHLNQGADLVQPQEERNQISQLNLMAVKKAKAAMAYEPALRYARVGLELLPPDGWQSLYDLTFALSVELLEIEYLNTNVERAEELSKEVLKQAQDLLEKVKIIEFQLYFYVFQNRGIEALDIASEVLGMLEVDLPTTIPEMFMVAQQLQEELNREISNISDLADLPVMNDPYQLAAMRILMQANSAAFKAKPEMLPLIIFTMVKLCIQHGNSALAAYGYGLYGLLLCAFYMDFDSGYQFGKLSLTILDKFNATDLYSKVNCIFNVSVRHWKEHVKETIEPLQEGIQVGIESGDVEYALYNALQYGFHLFFIGEPLDVVYKKQAQYLEMMEQFQLHFHAYQVHIRTQMVLNLIGESEDPCKLIGPQMDESKMLPMWTEQNAMLLLFLAYGSKTILCYLFKQYEAAIEAGELAQQYEQSAPGMVCIPESQFYTSLAMLAAYDQADTSTKEHYLTKVAANQEKMKFWAFHAPSNYQHKYDLVEAENARILNEPLMAMEYYDRTIQGARKYGYIQEEALANERAADFYLALGREEIGPIYMRKAHYGYKMWGAKRKVQQLEKSYAWLLTGARSVASIIDTQIATNSGATGSSSTNALDLTTVLKSSQAISGEIDLHKLLTKLIQIVIENAGAERGYLILEQEGKWLIQAKGTINQNQTGKQAKNKVEVLQAIPLEKTQDKALISTAIVNLVVRTGESVVLGDAAHEGPFTTDPVIAKLQPKSLLCMPLINQGQVSGILYLENNLSTNAFTPDRLTLLKLLSSQMAMSLDNAVLYDDLQQHRDHLEDLVSERTAELTQTLDNLKATQEQLIESEKMAALGGLVAGVAHEINTPVGIGITAASSLENETKLFVEACRTGLKRSALKTYIKTATQSSQLILNNLRRAAKLVHSFKQVAVDQTSLEKRSFGVKGYLESTLSSLEPKLKQNRFGSKNSHGLKGFITLKVTGDDNLTLHSYPGAFSQVITNLVMNSLTHAYKSGEKGVLSFELTSDENRLYLKYSDDGCGIPPENLSRIFEPFFTTARNQGGTGLGLHIVYNLVTQKLAGTIRCESEVGVGTTFFIDLPF